MSNPVETAIVREANRRCMAVCAAAQTVLATEDGPEHRAARVHFDKAVESLRVLFTVNAHHPGESGTVPGVESNACCETSPHLRR